MKQIKIELPKDEISSFCQRHHIKKLSIFGSALREDFHPESDIDILVEFEPGYTPGLNFFTIEEELSKILGKKVDLHTPNFLSKYFRDMVLKEAQIQYVGS